MYVYQLLALLETAHLGSYWDLNKDSPLIVYLIDIEKYAWIFFTVFAKKFDA